MDRVIHHDDLSSLHRREGASLNWELYRPTSFPLDFQAVSAYQPTWARCSWKGRSSPMSIGVTMALPCDECKDHCECPLTFGANEAF